jgi:ATP-dependent RNA helicase SUPV3L1/SUV3
MGLNLNIGRIVFHTTIKKGMDKPYFVEPSQVKQIAGRAGRLSSKYKVGQVTAWQEADLAYIRSVMDWELVPVPRAGIFPSVQQIEVFSEQLRLMWQDQNEQAASDADSNLVPSQEEEEEEEEQEEASATLSVPSQVNEKNVRLSDVLGRFTEASQLDGRFFLCDHESMNLVGNWLHTIPLTLADRFIFSNAPVSTRDLVSMNMLYQFAATYALGRPVALNVRLAHRSPKDVMELGMLLTKHNVLDLYIWLSFRFPKYFVERDLALSQKLHAVKNIQLSLDSTLVQAKYSHSEDYIKLRTKHMERSVDGLPPQGYGSVRDATRDMLKNIAPELLAVFPTLLEEQGDSQGAAASSKYSKKSSDSRGTSNGRKKTLAR